MRKRIMSLLLALCFMLTLTPVTLAADGGAGVECAGGSCGHAAAVTAGESTLHYENVKAAFDEATGGATLSLLADWTINESTVTLSSTSLKALTLDLNGHQFTLEGSNRTGVLQIDKNIDLTIVNTRKMSGSTEKADIRIENGNLGLSGATSSLTLRGLFVNATGSRIVSSKAISSTGQVTLEDTKLVGGISHSGAQTLTLKNSQVTGARTAIELGYKGTLLIEGDSLVEGTHTGINTTSNQPASSITILGGTVRATGAEGSTAIAAIAAISNVRLTLGSAKESDAKIFIEGVGAPGLKLDATMRGAFLAYGGHISGVTGTIPSSGRGADDTTVDSVINCTFGEDVSSALGAGLTCEKKGDKYIVRELTDDECAAKLGDVKYATVMGALKALPNVKSGSTVTLTIYRDEQQSGNEPGTLYLNANTRVTIDLNGHRLSYESLGIRADSGGTLTVKDGSAAGTGKITVTGKNNSSAMFSTDSSGKIVIESGTYETTGCIVKLYGYRTSSASSATINGGTFYSGMPYIVYGGGQGKVNEAVKDSLTVTGGSFYVKGTREEARLLELDSWNHTGINLTLPEDTLPAAQTPGENGYTQVALVPSTEAPKVAVSGGVNYPTLDSAIAAGGSEVEIALTGNVNAVYTTVIPAGKTVTLDLAGHTYDAIYSNAFQIREGGKLIIKDSGGTGTVAAQGDAVRLAGALEVRGGTVAPDQYAVYVEPNTAAPAEINVSGGALIGGEMSAILAWENTNVNIAVSGGRVSSRVPWSGGSDRDYAIEASGAGSVTVTDAAEIHGNQSAMLLSGSVTLNMTGGKLTAAGGFSDSNTYLIRLGGTGRSSITGGTISRVDAEYGGSTKPNKHDTMSGISVANGAEVVLGGTLEIKDETTQLTNTTIPAASALKYGVYASGGAKVTIQDSARIIATAATGASAVYQTGEASTVTLDGGVFTSSGAIVSQGTAAGALAVNGGAFKPAETADNEGFPDGSVLEFAESPVSVDGESGYSVLNSNPKAGVAQVGANAFYTDVASAVEAANTGDEKTVTVIANAEIKKNVTIDSDVTLEVSQGSTLTIAEKVTVTAAEGSTLTNNGSIVASGTLNAGNSTVSGDGGYAQVDQGQIELPGGTTTGKVEVTFKNDGGAVLQTSWIPSGSTPVYAGSTPTKPADGAYTYEFNGWNPEIGAVSADTVYTATYTRTYIEYTVTFDTQGGTPVDPVSGKHYGDKLEKPDSDPTKENYNFGGWYTDKACTDANVWNFDEDIVTGNMTLYAKWISPPVITPSYTSTTVINEDGSTTTTVTDLATGTVTTTVTRTDGVVVRTVDERGKDVTATVTIPDSVGTATVTIPAQVTPGTVAVDAATGKVIKLSVPTEDGMLVKLDGSAQLVLVDRSKDFDDVPGHWGEDSIDFAVAHGMFGGTGDTTFSPDSPMTRAMLMTVLARFDGANTEGGATWYEKGMEWAVDAGVSDGTNPDVAITREQLAAMLYRYADSPAVTGDLSHFVDADKVSGYAADAMVWAVSNGIIAGMGNSTLAPQGYATRAQVAAVLMRFCTYLTR